MRHPPYTMLAHLQGTSDYKKCRMMHGYVRSFHTKLVPAYLSRVICLGATKKRKGDRA